MSSGTTTSSTDDAMLVTCIFRGLMFRRVARLKGIEKWSLWFMATFLYGALNAAIRIPIAYKVSGTPTADLKTMHTMVWDAAVPLVACLFADMLLALICKIFAKGQRFSALCNIVKFSLIYGYLVAFPLQSLALLATSSKVHIGLNVIVGVICLSGMFLVYRNIKYLQ